MSRIGLPQGDALGWYVFAPSGQNMPESRNFKMRIRGSHHVMRRDDLYTTVPVHGIAL